MASEQWGFVFGVTFIIIFGALLSTVPLDFQGLAESPDMVVPVDPSLLTGFASTENWTEAAVYQSAYVYELGGESWVFHSYVGTFALGSKVLIGGVLWLGQLDSCHFITAEGVDRDGYLSIGEIEDDATDGVVRYDLYSIGSGNYRGGFVVYWNTTTYEDPATAHASDDLHFLHGIGFGESATANVGALLVSLLMLQIPNVPFLINVLIAVPIWASILFVLWFVIKEMIPFV